MKNLRLYFKIVRLILEGKEPIVEIFFKNKKVLDIGCGWGDFLVKDPQNFIGVDINEELLEKARERGLKVVKFNVKNLPFSDEEFDGVYCNNVIEHLFPEEAYKIFQETERVLKGGGIFIIGTEWPSQRIWDTFSHIRPYSPKSIVKLISEQHQETFVTLNKFVIKFVLYKGIYVKNVFLRVILWAGAVIFPFLRRDWIVVLKKQA